MDKQIFFQSSLPRSGSTLLQNLIAQHPKFYATPTSGLLEMLVLSRNYYTDGPEFKAQDSGVMREAFRGYCSAAVQGYFSALTDKPYVMDKCRGWGYFYDFADFFHENPKMICMVRDPRSVFASMEKNYRKHPDKSIVFGDTNFMDAVTVEDRVNIWANNPPVGLSMKRLQECILRGQAKKMLFVKYEDLVRRPQEQMDRVYKYLGVENHQHDFDNIEQVTQEDDKVHGIFGDHVIQPTLNIHKEDYVEVLGMLACRSIRDAYPWFYDYFQYH